MSMPIALGRSLLPDAVAALYTVPAANRLLLKQLVLCNQDVDDRTVTFYNAAGAAANANAFLHQAVVPAGETSVIPLSMCFATGNALRAFADVADVVSVSADGLLIEDDLSPELRVLARGFAPDASASLYESVAETTVVKHLSVCNVTGSSHDFSLWSVPDGETLDTNHALLVAKTIPGHTTLFLNLSLVLAPGDALYSVCDLASAITQIASGVAA